MSFSRAGPQMRYTPAHQSWSLRRIECAHSPVNFAAFEAPVENALMALHALLQGGLAGDLGANWNETPVVVLAVAMDERASVPALHRSQQLRESLRQEPRRFPGTPGIESSFPQRDHRLAGSCGIENKRLRWASVNIRREAKTGRKKIQCPDSMLGSDRSGIRQNSSAH